jgi:endoglucanase
LQFRLTGVFVLAVGLTLPGAGCSSLFPSNDIQPGSTTTWTVHSIRVDTVGYLRARAKVATVVPPTGTPDLSGAVAQIFSMNGVPQWSCQLSNAMTDPDTQQTYYWADFTGFDDPGIYYVAIPSLGADPRAQSALFEVSDNVFSDALTLAMTGLYGQRCGTAVRITLGSDTWSHPACHQQDAYCDYLTGADTLSPSVGGWHDAGDYGKYASNGAFSVGMLLAAWEHFQPTLQALTLPIPEHGKIPDGGTGPMPDFLWEVRWELDWLLSAQTASGGGGVPDKLTAINFESFGTMPDRDKQKRYFAGIGTAMTADVVAVMAAAARLYLTADPTSAGKYLTAAQLGYAYLLANVGPAVPANDDPAPGNGGLVFQTGHYVETDPDNRLWAAAEMWETTGDPGALADFESRASTATVDVDFDWGNVENLGFYTYLLSQRSDRDARNATLVSALSAGVIAAGDQLESIAATHAFGRALPGGSANSYYWGSNGSVARAAMNLWVANVLSPNPKYLDTIQMQLDFLLGRNPYDRSQVTMLGYHPPLDPHHGPSAGDGVADPWPGLLVGGANDDQATTTLPAALTWQDSSADYRVNEIAINWIAPFVYATAALTPPPM